MTYTEERNRLITNLKAEKAKGTLNIASMFDYPDFHSFHDIKTGNDFIVHKKELE